MLLRYAELHPKDLQAALDRGAPAVLPWGALEWHGDHLPFGLDGIVADAFAERLADRLVGVLLPTVWLPMTTLPHSMSLQVGTDTFRAILRETLSGLQSAGFKSILVVTGHYAQGHLWELFDGAMAAMGGEGFRVFAATPLAVLANDDLLDHAGEHETSQLLALRPDLVRLNELGSEIQPTRDGILGDHPGNGSAAEGERLFASALDAWAVWFDLATPASLRNVYEGWQVDLQPYRDKFYKESWEQAITDWWATKKGALA